jgi:hypothetical protein
MPLCIFASGLVGGVSDGRTARSPAVAEMPSASMSCAYLAG